MQLLARQCYYIFLLLLPLADTFAAVKLTENSTTQLQSWHLTKGDFSLKLIQRLPDQTRAFFQGRGFSKKIANDIALSCVFQAIGTNIGTIKNAESVSYSLKDWQVRVKQKIRKIKLKESWKEQWQKADVSSASKIAFTWATFPTKQRFAGAGDYGWGMISFDLPPETIFDLKVVWKQNNKLHHAWIHSLKCPEDR